MPIVEPEVLMDGGHDIDTCSEVTEFVLKEQFQELYYQKVALEGIVLKPNMVVPGKKSGKASVGEEVAEKTVKVLKDACRARCRASLSSPAASRTRKRPRISTP